VILFSTSFFATSLNGRFIVVKSDTSKLSVLLQINTDTGNDDMGGATIVLSFNKDVLSFSSDPISKEHYEFHNFSSGSYDKASVTRPLSDKLWINIYLPAENNKGTLVSGLSGWTDVVTLNFDVINPRDTARVMWLKSNIFWQIYDADNSTSWSTGNLTDFINAPVTLELLSFTAVLLDNSNIKLDWSTISYADSYGFEVERTDSDTTNWEKIGIVESKNILNTPVNYTFLDTSDKLNPILKYRIKSVNADATSTILKEIEVEVENAPLSFELAQNYPNPFNPSTTISWQTPVGSMQTLKVYDILGNEVATLVNEFMEAGQHEVEFEATNLASGVYVYRLQTATFTDTKKMMLLR
jgi:hypothetical protein